MAGSATSPVHSWGSSTEGDRNKSAPQVGGSTTSLLRSRWSPKKGTKSKVANKWAQKVRQPPFSGAPYRRGRKQKWTTSGRKCYITLVFSEVLNKRTKLKVAHKLAERLRHPCVLGGPQTRDKVKGGPQLGGSATSPLHSRRSPNKETKLKVAQKLAEVLHHPCVLRGPQTGEQGQRWPTTGRKCYTTTAFSGVP